MRCPGAMSAADCVRWATPLLDQADLSSLVARARCEAQRSKCDCEQSRQLLSKLQRRMEATDGCRQRETRRMIKLETTAEGLPSELERLVGTLAWQERRHASSHSRSPAVPGTLAWYRTLHSARANDSARVTLGEIVAGLEPVSAKTNVKGWRPHGSPPPCVFVTAGAVPVGKQTMTDGKTEPVDRGAQSGAESDTCSEASEASSDWSGSASGSTADEDACSVQTPAPDAGNRAQLPSAGRAPLRRDRMTPLTNPKSSPCCSLPDSLNAAERPRLSM